MRSERRASPLSMRKGACPDNRWIDISLGPFGGCDNQFFTIIVEIACAAMYRVPLQATKTRSVGERVFLYLTASVPGVACHSTIQPAKSSL